MEQCVFDAVLWSIGISAVLTLAIMAFGYFVARWFA
jgi:hypothetical protein